MGICCESELHIIYYGVMAIVVTLFAEVLIWAIIESWRNYRK